MTAIIAGILIASLLGSLHCAGMCGAFLALAVAPDERARHGAHALNIAYNLGRLVSYVALGALAGAIGRSLDLGGELLGVQRVAAIATSIIMIGFGLVAFARARGVSLPIPRFAGPFPGAVRRAYTACGNWSPLARAYAIGLLTTALPCGWLYAFVFSAAGTGSPAYGAIAMAAFWLGTLPVMATLGLGLQSLFGPLRRHLPTATALLLVLVGIATLAGRIRVMHSSGDPVTGVICHGG